MGEFIELLAYPVNTALSILLGGLMIYWVFVILGALDLQSMDFDLGVDADADVDADVDLDPDLAVDADVDGVDVHDVDLHADGDAHGVGDAIGGSSLLISGLKFFNVGEVPFMILISVLVLSMWMVSMLAGTVIGGFGQILGLLMIIPNLFLSLFIAKLVTTPLKGMYRHDDERAAKYRNLTGKRCIVCSGQVTDAFGQVELVTDGAPLLLNVRTVNGESLSKGDEAVIVDYDKERNIYRVAKFNLEGIT